MNDRTQNDVLHLLAKSDDGLRREMSKPQNAPQPGLRVSARAGSTAHVRARNMLRTAIDKVKKHPLRPLVKDAHDMPLVDLARAIRLETDPTKKAVLARVEHERDEEVARTTAYIRRAVRSQHVPVKVLFFDIHTVSPSEFEVPENMVIVYMNPPCSSGFCGYSDLIRNHNTRAKLITQTGDTYSVTYVPGDMAPNLKEDRRSAAGRMTLADEIQHIRQTIPDDGDIVVVFVDSDRATRGENLKKIIAMDRNAHKRAEAFHRMPINARGFDTWVKRAAASRHQFYVTAHGVIKNKTFIVPKNTVIIFFAYPGCPNFASFCHRIFKKHENKIALNREGIKALLRQDHPEQYSATFLQNDIAMDHDLEFYDTRNQPGSYRQGVYRLTNVQGRPHAGNQSGIWRAFYSIPSSVQNFNGKKVMVSKIVDQLVREQKPTEMDPLVLFISTCRGTNSRGNSYYARSAACNEATCNRAGASKRPKRKRENMLHDSARDVQRSMGMTNDQFRNWVRTDEARSYRRIFQ